MADDAVVLTERRGAVGIVYLNRPKQLNAWTGEMQTLCFNALDAMEADPEVRVIVLTGKGRAFCAGADMGMLSGAANSAGGGGIGKKGSGMGDRDVLYPMKILKPVIAAVNGAVAGIGLSLALACDIRFAAPKAKFLGAFSRRGLVAEYGSSWTLPNLLGTGNAMMFLMSSDTYRGEDCLALGMVQRCYPAEELLGKTVEFAQHLADKCSPMSMAAMKLQVWDHPRRPLGEALEESVDLMQLSITGGSPDFKEGVLSFLQKRPPRFPPLDQNNPVVRRAKQLLLRSKL